MYSLDINFLKDRPENQQNKGNRRISSSRLPAGNWNSIYVGLAAGALLPAIVGVWWLFLQNKNAQLESKNAEIDAQLNSLGIQEQQLQKIQSETNKIKTENQALATVFNQIHPWSATLQDLRDRIPAAVQIENIKQTALSTPQQSQPAPNSAPSAAQKGQSTANPAGGIEISGMASSFSDANDFLLTLQQSSFFKPTDTKIVTAELIDSPISAAGSVSKSPTALPVKLPQVVRYTIQSNLSDVPASKLIQELEYKGTFGLVNRIRTLQKIGVIQP